jgi:hypothetical protein
MHEAFHAGNKKQVYERWKDTAECEVCKSAAFFFA